MGFTTASIGSYIFSAADAAGISAGTVSAAGTAAEGLAGSLAAGAATNALYGAKKPVMPPSPVMGQQQQDVSTREAEENAQRRQSIAGGMNSTVGTSGGQAGAMLNPANLGNKTLLGQ